MDERSRRVLKAIVETYIGSPEPVGSRSLSKQYAFKLSPATIRNIMADLEEAGYLFQPHTSAGRVPTDRGFRLYVDELAGETSADQEEYIRLLSSSVENLRSGITDVLKEATRVLSDVSKYLVFAAPVRSDRSTLNRIQLIRYRGEQIVAVLVSNEGIVRNRILPSDLGLSQRELDRISDYINSEYSGWAVDDIRAEVMRQMSNEKAVFDMLISQAMTICEEALTFPMADMIVSGLPELLGLPEFSDRINEIAGAIEDKHRIIMLFDELLGETRGVQIAIGSEIPVQQMRGLSIVSAAYVRGDRSLGRLGVIGPTRMDYSVVISMVDQAAKFISTVISK